MQPRGVAARQINSYVHGEDDCDTKSNCIDRDILNDIARR